VTGAAIVILEALAAAAPSGGAAAEWRQVFEGRPGITSVRPASSFPGVDLGRPLMECPTLPRLTVEAVAAFNLQLDLGGGRRPDIDVFIGKLPAGTRAHDAVIGASAQTRRPVRPRGKRRLLSPTGGFLDRPPDVVCKGLLQRRRLGRAGCST
jgi:hypothetical protein